jgi:hypothetical protein
VPLAEEKYLLFVVGSTTARSFVDFNPGNRNGTAQKQFFKLFKNETRDIFGRGIDIERVKNRVQVFMVEFGQDSFEVVFENFKINTQPRGVERFAPHGCPDEPVMAVKVFARPMIVFQPVRCGERGFDGYFEHNNLK